MTAKTFSAQVTWNISSIGLSSPSNHDSNSYKKKRSSGLELLRPKSSHGSARHAMISPEPFGTPMSDLLVSPIPAPETICKDDKLTAQKATLRHTRSIPHLQHASSPQERDDKRGKRSNRWKIGRLEVILEGTGGSQGGSLTIFEGEVAAVRQQIKPLPQHTWSCDDVQQVHSSVHDRLHVLSLRLPKGEIVTNSKRASRSKGLNLASLSKIGRRARGYTITRMDLASTSTTDSTHAGSENAESIDSHISETDGSNRLYLLAFPSLKTKWEWYSLFRSFGGCPFPRTHRRLQLRILDLQEIVPLQAHLNREDTSSTQVRIPSVNESGSQSIEGQKASKERVKSGWATREKLRIEIWLDNQVMGRTTWTRAEEGSCIPFWAELFIFEEIPDFSTCVLKVCRAHSGKSQAFAIVSVPLITSYQKVTDERHPIISPSTEGVIGELRMIVSYQAVNVISGHEYVLPEVFWGMGGTRTIYYLVSRGDLDQAMDLFTRFNWGIGTTLQRLYEMAEIEARASGDTLFRSNTPLTRLLESTMRLVCGDFLRLSIGRTVTAILANEIEVAVEEPRVILKLVRDCWEDMYSQRGSFPNILRLVFAKLFKSVKENHEQRKLHYKAVSSFLFLRLIGPALMRPHLFDLAAGLPTVAVQKTLTLVAKVFHAMAFFTHNDTARDPDLRKFVEFIRDNDEMMVDYLSSFATPLDAFQAMPPRPTPIETFLVERGEIMPNELAEAVPKMTVAGPVEMTADGAVFWELLYQRRRSVIAGHNPRQAAGRDEELEILIRTMDRFLLHVHRRSHRQPATIPERASTPRPSLQIDVTAARQDWDRNRNLYSRHGADLFGGSTLSHQDEGRSPDHEPSARHPNKEEDSEYHEQREGRHGSHGDVTDITSELPSGQAQAQGLGSGSGSGPDVPNSGGKYRVTSPATWKWLNLGWMSPTFHPPYPYPYAHGNSRTEGHSHSHSPPNSGVVPGSRVDGPSGSRGSDGLLSPNEGMTDQLGRLNVSDGFAGVSRHADVDAHSGEGEKDERDKADFNRSRRRGTSMSPQVRDGDALNERQKDHGMFDDDQVD